MFSLSFSWCWQMKMDPTAFRAQLLMNFRVRLGPGELGAVFTAFDKDNSKLIDGTEVLTHNGAAYFVSRSKRRMMVGQRSLCGPSLRTWRRPACHTLVNAKD